MKSREYKGETMNYDYDIITDLSIDVDPDFVSRYGIKYMPMEYTLGEEVFKLEQMQTDEELEKFYEQLRNKVPTSTTQINTYSYIELFTPYIEADRPVLFFSLSSGLSNTYESAMAAMEVLREDYKDKNIRIEIFDTLRATIGMGFLMEIALLNREKGMSLEENADFLRKIVKNVKTQFMVSDLFYLMRGGRVSAPTATLGTALNLRPILIIDDEGKLPTIAKKRGNKLALKYLASLFETDHDGSYYPELAKRVYIVHGGCRQEADALKKMLLEKDPELSIYTCTLNPVIGAHTGADMVGVVFLGKEWE